MIVPLINPINPYFFDMCFRLQSKVVDLFLLSNDCFFRFFFEEGLSTMAMLVFGLAPRR
jgi:hypothetical protein